MNRTKIEWCDWTWNPITGCLHGCPYCYARKAAEDGPYLRGRAGYDAVQPFAPAFHPLRLEQPLRVKRPGLVFVFSMGDALGEWVPREWISRVIDTCRAADWHRFLWLTKNPERYADFTWPENCWLGTSVTGEDTPENRARLEAISDIEVLAPAQFRVFVSVEPFTLGDGQAPALGFGFPAWVIIGAQTKPSVMPSELALSRAVAMTRELEIVSLFLKDSLRPVWERIAPGQPMPRQWPAGLRLEHGKSSEAMITAHH